MHNSNSNTHVLEVSEFYVAFSHIVWCKRESLIQDGGKHSKYLYLGPNTT